MKIIDSIVTGNLFITADTQYNNVTADNVVIEENIKARIYGEIKKDITLNKGSKLYLHGNYHGEIINNGGEIEVY
ncbi:MAG: hypothetical protein V4565_08620 [Bacteroidota bacterium]